MHFLFKLEKAKLSVAGGCGALRGELERRWVGLWSVVEWVGGGGGGGVEQGGVRTS